MGAQQPQRDHLYPHIHMSLNVGVNMGVQTGGGMSLIWSKARPRSLSWPLFGYRTPRWFKTILNSSAGIRLRAPRGRIGGPGSLGPPCAVRSRSIAPRMPRRAKLTSRGSLTPPRVATHYIRAEFMRPSVRLLSNLRTSASKPSYTERLRLGFRSTQPRRLPRAIPTHSVTNSGHRCKPTAQALPVSSQNVVYLSVIPEIC